MHLRRAGLASLLLACALMTGACSSTFTPTPSPTVTATPSPAASLALLSATVHSSTPLSGFPGGPATGSHALWYWDESTGDVVRLDTTTGRVVAEISLGDPSQAPYGSPKTVVANGQVVWVTDVVNHAVARIDPATNRIVKRIALDKVASPSVTGPIDPFGLALDGSGLWVSDFDRGIVLRVDTTSGLVTNVVAGIDHPEGLATGFGSLWVVEHRNGAIARIDLASAARAATIALPGTAPQAVCGMCVNNVVASGDSVWVPLNLGNGVVRIDPTTNAVSGRVPFDRVVDSLAVGSGAVWAAAWDGSIPCTDSGAQVARIDTATNSVSETKVIACAVSAAVADGDVWVGTADAPNGVTRLRVGP